MPIRNLPFPVAGLNRSRALNEQPPFSTNDCLNMRVMDVVEKRARGGSRPGLRRAYYDELGAGTPVRMLTEVTIVDESGFRAWCDTFGGGSLGDDWVVASWVGALPGVLENDAAALVAGEAVGAVAPALAIDKTRDYEVGIWVVPYQAGFHGSYQLYARMDASPVATTNGIVASLEMTGTGGVYAGTLKSYVSGVMTSYAFTGGTIAVKPGWFRLLISGNTIKCYWQGVLMLSQAVSAHTGTRIGFGMTTSVAGGANLVGKFLAQYYEATQKHGRRKMLVASAGGSLYREGLFGHLDLVNVTPTLASDRSLWAAERAQKLYIADNSDPRVHGTDGTIGGAGSNELTAAGVTDWTTYGINVNTDVCVVADVTGTVVAGTYRITAVVAAKVTLTGTVGVGTCTYWLERGPKVYDPKAGTLGLWTASASKGQVPTGCGLVCLYRDRLVLAGSRDDPTNWYMSRQGDPLDWDYGAAVTDAGRAMAGTSSDAGKVGDVVNALVPLGDDYLIFGGHNSLWVLRGDPAYGGELDNLSREFGILSQGAWCYGPAGVWLFLCRDGLYALSADLGSKPESLSRERLPAELRDIDTTSYTVSMSYDLAGRGVHIFVTPVQLDDSVDHWWFDWTHKGFWRDRYQNAHCATVVWRYLSDLAVESAVLVGGRDGYVRRLDEDCETDDGTAMESWVNYGPMALVGDGFHRGQVTDLVARLGLGGGDVTWGAYLHESAEAVARSAAVQTGTWSAGLNDHARSIGSAYAFMMRMAGTGRKWSVEEVTMALVAAGAEGRAY